MVKRLKGRAPQPVVVTIDPTTQQAAEAALAGVTLPAGLVAIDVPTGQIRAVVSKPDEGFERALDGAYPPGSTFKVITSAALLDGRQHRVHARAVPAGDHRGRPGRSGISKESRRARSTSPARSRSRATTRSSASPTSCRRTRSPGRGVVRLRDQVVAARAVVRRDVPEAEGPRRARRVGDRAGPCAREPVADGVGRGRGRLGSVAGAGTHDPARAASPVATPAARAATSSRRCNRSWRASCSRAAPRRARACPSGTCGKTGTAEFGSGNPPPTHAWFIGYRGNIAFAVIVEGGGVGGRVAAPLAANFRTRSPEPVTSCFRG